MVKTAIPVNATELEEMLNDSAKMESVFADQSSFREFISNYASAKAPKADAVAKDIAAQVSEGVMNTLKDLGVERPDIRPGMGGAERAAAYNPHAVGVQMDKLGFKNLGDMAKTLLAPNANREADPKIVAQADAVMRNYSSIDPTSGGYLIPETMRAEIMSIALESSIVRSRASVITMDSATLGVPFVHSTTNQGSVFGGMVFYWTPESGEIIATSAKFGRVKLEANKLTGGARIPNELWNDGRGLTSFLNMSAPAGLNFTEDVAFLVGDGVDKPLGALASPARVVVAKETNQPNFTIKTPNILKMYSRMLPSSLSRGVWVVNQTTFEQLNSLTMEVGTGGSAIGLLNIKDGPLPTMLTRPVIITEKVPALGSEGDVNFIDFGYYLIGDRQAVSVESSGHSRFMNDETELRIISRVDGRPWIQSSIQPLNGDPLSPIVTLGARS